MSGATPTGAAVTLASGGPGWFIVPFILLVVALAILGIWWEHRRRAERRRRYREIADRLGLEYTESPGLRLDQEFPAFTCFAQGHSRRLNHLLRGEIRSREGHPNDVLAGEWQFSITVSNGKTTTTVTYRFGFVILGLRMGRCPAVAIRGENLMDRLAGALGWDDIDFESVEFSRRFHVKSEDKRFAYDLIDARVMEHFLAASPAPDLELAGVDLCLHRGVRKHLEPDGVSALLDWGLQLVDRIPRLVRAGVAEGRYGAQGI